MNRNLKKEITPMEYSTDNLISECCGAIPITEPYENMGMCSKCRDNTEFYEEDDDKKKRT